MQRRTVLRMALMTLAVTLFASAVPATAAPIRAAVVRSTGTFYLGMTIWSDLNNGWANFGDTEVAIDYWSLAGNGWGADEIAATNADVLILSNPAFLTYRAAEIDAIIDYVQDGHGLIITYGKFRSEDRRLAPLVGLSESIQLGTGTATDPFWLDPQIADHPIFDRVTLPYVSGTRAGTTGWGQPPWPLDGGTVVAELLNDVIRRQPGIVINDEGAYRGTYFQYYPEDKSGGSNQQDMQIFYNALVWTANVPEPATGLLVMSGLLAFARRNRRR